MSDNARRNRRSTRHLCRCGRPARYFSRARGTWRWRIDHPLCPACHRQARDAFHARRLASRAGRGTGVAATLAVVALCAALAGCAQTAPTAGSIDVTGSAWEGDQPGECDDGADNDRNGLFDCLDPGCAGSPACEDGDDDTDPTWEDDDTDTVDQDDDDSAAPGPGDEELPAIFDSLGSPDGGSFTEFGDPWPDTALTWALDQGSEWMGRAEARTAIAQAMALWSAACQSLSFEERPLDSADIVLSFEVGDHGDDWPFDGTGDPQAGFNVLAHAFSPTDGGGVHFDDADRWTAAQPLPAGWHDLVTVAAHEIGHALGIGHSEDPDALMHATPPAVHRFLGTDDVVAITSLYTCTACLDEDGDGFGAGCAAGDDCDDTDADRYPSAPELPDYVDDDCDGLVDEGHRVEVYRHHWSSAGDSDHLLWWTPTAPAPGWVADGTGFLVYSWNVGAGADTVIVGPHQLGLLRQCEAWPQHLHVYCMVDAAECMALQASPAWTCVDFGYVNSTLSVAGDPLAVAVRRIEHSAWTDVMYGTTPAEGAALGYVDLGPAWWAWSGN